jgi:hypothetical protein
MPVTATTWNTFASTASATTRTTTSAVLPAGAYLSITMALTTSFAGGLITVTDSAGGSWTQIDSTTSGQSTRTFWRTTVGTGSSFTVTIVSASSTICYMVGTYFTGASGSYSSVTTVAGTTAYANVTTPSATKSGDLYFGMARASLNTNGTPTYTPGATWTALGNASIATNGSRGVHTQYKLATGATTTTTGVGTSSLSTSATTMSAFVVYEATASTSFSGWGIPL